MPEDELVLAVEEEVGMMMPDLLDDEVRLPQPVRPTKAANASGSRMILRFIRFIEIFSLIMILRDEGL